MKRLLFLTLLLIPFFSLQAQEKPEDEINKHFQGMADAIKASPDNNLAATRALAVYHITNRKDIQTQISALTTSWDNIKDIDKKSATVDTFLKSFEIRNKEFFAPLNELATKIFKDKTTNLEAQKIFIEFQSQFSSDLKPIEKYVATYSKTAKQATCIININNIQKSVRSIQNLEDLKADSPLTWKMIVGLNKPLSEKPTCPSGGTYTLSKTIPAEGTPACTCDHPKHQLPKEKTQGW